MSGSVAGPAFQFEDVDRVDLRRFCGYPPYGNGLVIFPAPWFFRYYLALEARLNNMTATEGAVILTHLAQTRTLEVAIVGTSDNLDTDRAAVWFHNKNELTDRSALYRQWRMELCGKLGVPPGPNLKAAGITLHP